jgi:RNA-binding protein
MPRDEEIERRPRKRPVRRNKPKKPEETRVPMVDPTTGPAKRSLRALGHGLDPVLSIGKDGLTDGVVAACAEALLAHELIKVRVLAEAPVDRKEVAAELAEKTTSTLAQVLGRTFLLYKRHPKKPRVRIEV